MFYWVVQELGSQVYLHGPYRTSQGRDNRFERVFGGEVHRFNSFSDSADEVRKEFLDERTKSLLGDSV